MSTILPRLILALALVSLAGKASAQRLQVVNYSIGSRVAEVKEIGGNPTTIARLLKKPVQYRDYLSGVQYNGFSGGLAIQRLHTYYLSTELGKPTATAGFWRKNTIQTGLFFSNELVKDGMSVENFREVEEPNNAFIINRDRYSLIQKQRFFGAVIGVDRRFRLASRLQFLTGLHAQGSVAAVHTYQQQWDSTSFIVQNQQVVSQATKISQLPELKGKNFFQWQAMLPLGLEVDVYQQRLFVRAEATLGIVGGDFRPKDLASREAHGLGLWLVYKPSGN